MKIGVFELEEWEQKYFKSKLKRHKLIFNDHLTKKTVSSVKDCDAVVVFIHSEINKEILDRLPKLKLIATLSTGYDHIDITECFKRKIKICYVPKYGENTIAEHAFGLLLGLSKRIVDGAARTRKGKFDAVGLTGFDLCGKTLGVIGMGNIGKHSAMIGNGFNMNVIGFNRSRDKKLAEKIGFRYVELDYLLKYSDVITLHLPLIPGTKHIINKKRVMKMKKGCVLINTARGGLVDTNALIYGLEKEIISGFGADVLEGEEFMRDHRQLVKSKGKRKDLRILKQNYKLLKKHNVIITPHSAANTKEATLRILNTGIENINSFSKGKLKNEIKKGR